MSDTDPSDVLSLPAPVPEDDDATAFPVVGIGASAGGLDALDQFFASVPVDSGMAFVVVTHTHPGQTSLLPQLLGRQTRLPVTAVEVSTPVEPDHVYVAPVGRHLAIRDNVLEPVELSDAAQRGMAVDYFFRSLAADRKRHAIGVVLSGTGFDGTLGVKEIKAASGLVVAQEESSAHYPSMPRSAAATEHVDFVLAPGDIPARLVDYTRRAFPTVFAPRAARSAADDDDLAPIFQFLRQRCGHDFSSYKLTTMRRRIERRMHVHRVATAADYARFLDTNPAEIDALFHELLIGVTSFFRDPEAFDALAPALTALSAERSFDRPLRVWVPGCSTGEEAYSLAILIRECQEAQRHAAPAQIFATDLDPAAIDTARVASYPDTIRADVSPERLARWFVHDGDVYRIRKDLREMVVFAPHNAASDPPFTRIDLLSCRNLLIYLDASLQARLLPLFHYALRRGGLLFLGSSESVGPFGGLFDVVDKKWKIFRRREVEAVGGATRFIAQHHDARLVGRGALVRGEAVTSAAERLLFQRLVPPSLIVRDNGEIVHIHGRTGELLELPAGPLTTLNVLAMARDGLGLDLAGALREASLDDRVVTRRGVRVRSSGRRVLVDLRVERLADPDPFQGLLLVSFERMRPDDEAPGDAPELATNGRFTALERELRQSKAVHQSVIEELETANEELKSTNEELQSTNEELQSTNEELETVNAELHDKLAELSRANDDMTNLLNATDIATVFLDDQLRIKRYTEQAREVIPLIPPDVGRPISDLVSRLRYATFEDDAREVLRTLVFKETEVRSEDGKWYLTRILPYRTTENVIVGLVITFVEVTRVKGLQEQASAILTALTNSPTTVFGQDRELRYIWVCNTIYGVPSEKAIGRTDADLLPAGASRPLDQIKQRVMSSGAAARERVVIHFGAEDRAYDVYIEARRTAQGDVSGLSGVMTELTPP